MTWLGMQERDGRNLPDAALEVLRERAVTMLEAGDVQALITAHAPDELGLPFALWSRAAVREPVRARMGVTVAIRTVGDHLHRWSLTPQRPIRQARERQDTAVPAWLAARHPKIAARAKAEGAQIPWGDETGIASQAACGRSHAPKGRTPVLRRTARRRTTGMISSMTNRGMLRFMICEGARNAGLLPTFLQRLMRSAAGKVFLIVDNLKVHPVGSAGITPWDPAKGRMAGKAQAWVARHRDRIELVFLPSCAPEHNPDEFLHHELKQGFGRQPAAKDREGLEKGLRRCMRRLQREPARVRACFRAPTTRHAA